MAGFLPFDDKAVTYPKMFLYAGSPILLERSSSRIWRAVKSEAYPDDPDAYEYDWELMEVSLGENFNGAVDVAVMVPEDFVKLC